MLNSLIGNNSNASLSYDKGCSACWHCNVAVVPYVYACVSICAMVLVSQFKPGAAGRARKSCGGVAPWIRGVRVAWFSASHGTRRHTSLGRTGKWHHSHNESVPSCRPTWPWCPLPRWAVLTPVRARDRCLRCRCWPTPRRVSPRWSHGRRRFLASSNIQKLWNYPSSFSKWRRLRKQGLSTS